LEQPLLREEATRWWLMEKKHKMANTAKSIKAIDELFDLLHLKPKKLSVYQEIYSPLLADTSTCN
jgi:hypothetical protein